MILEAAVKGDQLVIAAELGLAHKFRGVVLMYLNDNLEYCVRAKIHLQRESVGSLCTVSIFDQETVDIVTNNQSATQKYQVRNLTILNELEVFLNELEQEWNRLPRSCSDQKQLMEKMLDFGLYSKLAEYVLMEDSSKNSRF